MAIDKAVVTAHAVAILLLCVTPLAHAQSTNQSDAELRYRVAEVALRDGNVAVAKRELEAAAQLAPENALIQYNLAIVNRRIGDPAQALQYLRRAIALGLPAETKRGADELLPALIYEGEKSQQEVSDAWNLIKQTLARHGVTDAIRADGVRMWTKTVTVTTDSSDTFSFGERWDKNSRFTERGEANPEIREFRAPLGSLSADIGIRRSPFHSGALLEVTCERGERCVQWRGHDSDTVIRLELDDRDAADHVSSALQIVIRRAKGGRQVR